MKILNGRQFADVSWVIHGFSTRLGGVSKVYGGGALNLGFTQHDTRTAVTRNRERFLARLRPEHERSGRLVTLRQVHSDIVHRVSGGPEQALTGDGIITDTPGLLLAIQTADCLPVLLVDINRHAVGAFHAGWRGTVQRIVENPRLLDLAGKPLITSGVDTIDVTNGGDTAWYDLFALNHDIYSSNPIIVGDMQRIVEKGVGEIQRRFGSRPRDLRAAIGPGIHGCCYEVGEEVREQFESQFGYAGNLFREVKDSDPVREKYPLLFLSARPPGHSRPMARLFLDLVEANRRQLLDSGVLAKNIESLPFCTSCRTDLLFSYRKEKGVTGRLLVVVGIRKGDNE